MKIGDLVRFKKRVALKTFIPQVNPRKRYPWKFDVGVVVDDYGVSSDSFSGKEVEVYFPNHPEKHVLCDHLEVVSESR